MNPRGVHFYFPIFGTLFIPINTIGRLCKYLLGAHTKTQKKVLTQRLKAKSRKCLGRQARQLEEPIGHPR
jgi:hypothetical protein